MRTKIILPLITGCFAAALFFGWPPQAPAPSQAAIVSGAPGSFADMVEKLLPAVVNISSTQRMLEPQDYPEIPQFPPGSPFEDFFKDFMDRRGQGVPDVAPTSLGSGFVIDAEKGLIVTNNHVIKDAEEVRVTFHDDVTVKADVLGRDEKTDLAVLKVKTDKKLTAVQFGNSDVLRVGDWVVAIGNPFGLGGTVTAGIISARQRDIQAGPYDDFIQTDASINRGNSGGPMFDLNGQVIGINTAIFSPSGGSVGIGFAIPSALAKPVIDQIIEFGRTRRGWIGVRIQAVTDEIAESLGSKGAGGALVASITPKGPAEVSGLKPGDIIVSFNGQRITAMKDLPRKVAEAPINTNVEIVYLRDGKEMKGSIVVAEMEKAEEQGLVPGMGPRPETLGTKIDLIGLKLEPLSDDLRQAFSISPNVEGVLVTGVDDSSEAAEKGLIDGDVIVEINQQPVRDPLKAKDIIEKAKQTGRASVLLLVNSAGEVRFVALKLAAAAPQ